MELSVTTQEVYESLGRLLEERQWIGSYSGVIGLDFYVTSQYTSNRVTHNLSLDTRAHPEYAYAHGPHRPRKGRAVLWVRSLLWRRYQRFWGAIYGTQNPVRNRRRGEISCVSPDFELWLGRWDTCCCKKRDGSWIPRPGRSEEYCNATPDPYRYNGDPNQAPKSGDTQLEIAKSGDTQLIS